MYPALLRLIPMLAITTLSRADAEFPAGIWQNPDYGMVLDARKKPAALFDLSSAGCVLGEKLSAKQLRGYFGSQFSVQEQQLLARSGISEYRFHRVLELPKQCAPKERLAGGEPVLNTKVLIATLEQFEIASKRRGLDWQAIRTEYLARAAKTRGKKALWQLLGELVQGVADPHVSLQWGDQEISGVSAREKAFIAEHGMEAILVRKGLKDYLLSQESPLIAPLKVSANRKIAYGELPGKVGYIVPLTMGGYTETLSEQDGADAHAADANAVLDALFAQYQDSAALIIDLRFNQGGFDSVALAWAARIAKQQTLAFRKQAGSAAATEVWVKPYDGVGFRGKVAVLLGHYTVSAGETAAQALSVLPNVITVGQATQGALSDAIPKTLPNGWRFSVSIESFVTPSGEALELIGIVPAHASQLADRSTPETRYGAEIKQALQLLGASAR